MNLVAEVSTLRQQIADTKDLLDANERGPRSHAEIKADIAVYSTEALAEVQRRIATRVQNLTSPAELRGALSALIPAGGHAVDLGPVLAALLGPEALAERLASYLDGAPDGIATTDRALRRSQLLEELFRLELAEERLIEQSEEEGAPIARRADADPRAVLWMEPEEPIAAAPGTEEAVTRRGLVQSAEPEPLPRVVRSRYLERRP